MILHLPHFQSSFIFVSLSFVMSYSSDSGEMPKIAVRHINPSGLILKGYFQT